MCRLELSKSFYRIVASWFFVARKLVLLKEKDFPNHFLFVVVIETTKTVVKS